VGAEPLCGYDAYRPATLASVVAHDLRATGIVELTPALPLPAGPVGARWLGRDGAVVGMVAYAQDTEGGTSSVQYSDAAGKPIFTAAERVYPCPPDRPLGRCHLVEITTSLDAVPSNPPPFSVLLDPVGGLLLEKYGEPVLPQDWRPQFGETVRWLEASLSSQAGVPLAPVDPRQRLFLILASDPEIAPYVGRLTIAWASPYWVITGVVPSNEVYDLILGDLQAQGIYAVRPDMIIDTRTALPPRLEINLAACYE
jgi:hypothetical protein